MTGAPIVINFGAPRSGTTWMWRCTKAMGVFAWKLTENSAFHPCWSDSGLTELVKSLHKHPTVVIRTVRHPLEIAESFAATRTDALRAHTPGLAQNDHDDVVRWIRSESEGFHKQTAIAREVIEARYDDMPDPAYRSRLVERVREGLGSEAGKKLRRALDTFGGSPARKGRLSAGLGRVLTDEEREWYREQLADVIEREGFE